MFVVLLLHNYRQLPSRFLVETFRIQFLALAPVIFVAPLATVQSDLLTACKYTANKEIHNHSLAL